MSKKSQENKFVIEQIKQWLQEKIDIYSVVIAMAISAVSLILFSDKYSEKYRFLSVLAGVIVVITLILIIYIKKSIIDSTEKRYDQIRENLERDIIELQTKLSNTEEQWKASYHLILSSQLKSNGGNDDAIRQLKFLKNFGLHKEDFIVNRRLVFYLTSFSSNYDSTYLTCKDVCEQMSLTLIRGDEFESTGDIFSQIIRYIVKSSLIIVNIDGKNPNVFYELGIAHALGKNVMFISHRDNSLPFDVRQYRTIFYSKNIDLKESLSKEINKYINSFDK